MAQSLKIIGNYLVITNTVTGTTIEYPTNNVRYKDDSTNIRFSYINDDSQSVSFLFSELVDENSVAFTDINVLLYWLRSNTGNAGQLNNVDLTNSTNIPLGISGTFMGQWIDSSIYGTATISLISDQDSAIDGLVIEYSDDGITVVQNDVFSIYANNGKVFSFGMANRYMRVRYINGLVAQTIFNIQTIFKNSPIKNSSHRIQDAIVGDDDAELIKSVSTGLAPDGTFKNVKVTNTGNQKVSIEEFETQVSVNSNTQLKTTLFDSTGVEIPFNSNGIVSKEFLLEIALGNIPGYSKVHKFGRNLSVGTALEPIAPGGIYQTPTGTVTLAVISDDVDDTAAGTGAQEITLSYLDTNFVEQTATIQTNGTTESTETVAGVKRLLRAYVSRSGTYATSIAASQQGTITIRVAGGGDAWTTLIELGTTGFGLGQSLIGVYTVPAGKTAYILKANFSVDGTKTATMYFFKRENADDITSPYSGILRIQNVYPGVSGFHENIHLTYEAYPEKTDLGWMATAPVSTDISSEFEFLLIDN